MLGSTASRLKQAVLRGRQVSREAIMDRLFALWFRRLVYTQIWEDPRVDAEALRLDDTSRVFTVSSAGCNLLNYLTHQPRRILAVDLNRAHMALTRLRLAALAHLPSHEAFFQFFGVGAGPENIKAYHRHIQSHLSDSTRRFWEARRMAGLRRSRRLHRRSNR